MKKRIIPSILLISGTSVSLSQQFKPWRTVGTLMQQLRLHIRRQCDELLIINLDQASSLKFTCSQRLFALVRQEVDVPIAYAGGISSETDAAACINNGFDRVFLTSAFLEDQTLVKRIAGVIGSQSVGVCLPYRRYHEDKTPYVWDYRTREFRFDLPLLPTIQSALLQEPGEILLYDVDRDGTLEGMDHQLIDDLDIHDISIPILLAGGASTSSDISHILQSPSVQGIVAGSIFSLTKETPTTIRSICENSGLPMRRI